MSVLAAVLPDAMESFRAREAATKVLQGLEEATTDAPARAPGRFGAAAMMAARRFAAASCRATADQAGASLAAASCRAAASQAGASLAAASCRAAASQAGASLAAANCRAAGHLGASL